MAYPIILYILIVIITICRQTGCSTMQEREEKKIQAWKVGLLGAFVIYPSVSATVLLRVRGFEVVEEERLGNE